MSSELIYNLEESTDKEIADFFEERDLWNI